MQEIEIVIPKIKANIDGVELDEELEQPLHSELVKDPDTVAENSNGF